MTNQSARCERRVYGVTVGCADSLMEMATRRAPLCHVFASYAPTSTDRAALQRPWQPHRD